MERQKQFSTKPGRATIGLKQLAGQLIRDEQIVESLSRADNNTYSIMPVTQRHNQKTAYLADFTEAQNATLERPLQMRQYNEIRHEENESEGCAVTSFYTQTHASVPIPRQEAPTTTQCSKKFDRSQKKVQKTKIHPNHKTPGPPVTSKKILLVPSEISYFNPKLGASVIGNLRNHHGQGHG